MAGYIKDVKIGSNTYPVASSLYGTCDTAAATAAKVGTCAAFDTLATGVAINIKMTNSNTAASPTMNVNGTGAKAIKVYGTTNAGNTVATSWNAGAILNLVYDGTNWIIANFLNTDTTYTAATAAPGKIAASSSQGSSTNYARQDHTHGIDLATGDANGQVKIAGTNVSVKGLAAMAYKASVSKSDVGLGNVDNTADADKPVSTAVQAALNAKANQSTTYTKTEVDSLISSVFNYKGTKSTVAEVNALTGMKTGDVWFVSADNSEYAYNGTKWEKLGPTIDLSGYLTSVSVAGTSLTPSANAITAAQLKTALGLKSAAYVATESSVANDGNLPTGAAVKSFVEGKGYTTNTGTVTSVSGATGLTGTVTGSGSIKAKLVSETKLTNAAAAAVETAGRVYPVALDKDGNLSVNVPWTDSGSAGSIDNAHRLTTPRAIDGVNFDGSAPITHYGVCSTAAGTVAKEVSITGFVLAEGASVYVKFANTNSGAVASLTLNVSSTGAKPIKRYGTTNLAAASNLYAGKINHFIYDGTNWLWVGDINTNDNNYDRAVLNRAVKAATAVTAGSIIVGTAAGYKTAAAGVTFDVSYPVLWAYGAIAANSTATNTYLYYTAVDLTKTVSGWTGTQYATVYLVGTLNGSTFTVANPVLTTTVPSSADGKVYIPLGLTYSTTACYFYPARQMFMYTGGSFSEVGGYKADYKIVTMTGNASPSSTYAKYPFEYVVTWDSATADSWVDGDLLSGDWTGAWAVDTANGYVTIYFETNPTAVFGLILEAAHIGNITGVTDYNTMLSMTHTGTYPDTTLLKQMCLNFQDGCSTLAGAITDAGVTTASNASPTVMATNIGTVATEKYAEGHDDGWLECVNNIGTRLWKLGASIGTHKAAVTLNNLFVLEKTRTYRHTEYLFIVYASGASATVSAAPTISIPLIENGENATTATLTRIATNSKLSEVDSSYKSFMSASVYKLVVDYTGPLVDYDPDDLTTLVIIHWTVNVSSTNHSGAYSIIRISLNENSMWSKPESQADYWAGESSTTITG